MRKFVTDQMIALIARNCMKENEIIGANLKRYREHLGLTQDMLAQYLGVLREEVSYYEHGKRSIPTSVLSKAAELFGVDAFDFYESDALAGEAKVALAFRADALNADDLHHVAAFRKIVLNYLSMNKVIADESAHS
jgi:transcriptional regulator with XRE-family HTH domain